MSFVIPSVWEAAGLLCKLLLYFAVAAMAGSALNLAFYSDASRRSLQGLLVYALVGSVLGFHAVLVNYLVQVGMINLNGIAGMLDWPMIRLLMDTPVGEATLWRLVAFTAGSIALGLCLRGIASLNRPPSRRRRHVLVLVPAMTLVLLAFSFRSYGHVSVLGGLAQLAVVLHVLAMAAWVGSLYPLYRLTGSDNAEHLAWVMRKFGDHARLLLVVLIVAGIVMLWGLLQSPDELWRSAYGISLTLKFTLVAAMLGFAAMNRYKLVPVLAEPGGAQRLRRSIAFESLLALLILLLTAYLSTLVGPMEHQ